MLSEASSYRRGQPSLLYQGIASPLTSALKNMKSRKSRSLDRYSSLTGRDATKSLLSPRAQLNASARSKLGETKLFETLRTPKRGQRSVDTESRQPGKKMLSINLEALDFRHIAVDKISKDSSPQSSVNKSLTGVISALGGSPAARRHKKIVLASQTPQVKSRLYTLEQAVADTANPSLSDQAFAFIKQYFQPDAMTEFPSKELFVKVLRTVIQAMDDRTASATLQTLIRRFSVLVEPHLPRVF